MRANWNFETRGWNLAVCIFFQFIEPELFDTEKESTVDQLKYIKPIILTRAVMTVSYVEKADVKDAEAIAKASLVPAHHPCIGKKDMKNFFF